MAVSMLDNFDIRKSSPNVKRDMFETLADMKDFNENYLPSLFIATCVETGLPYLFNKANTVDDETGKWRVLSGGSADLLNYYTKSEINTLLELYVEKETGKGLSTNDYDDTEKAQVQQNKEDIATLNSDSTVTGSVDSKVAQGVSDANTYTDEQIALLNVDEAIKCDAMPTYDSTTDKITYVKGGVSTTIDAGSIWFYYEDSDKLMQSILIDGEWTTIVSAGGVNFSEYVSKTTDVVSTYTGEEVATNKVPDLAAMKALQTLIETEINGKVSTSQGSTNANKAVITDENGDITLAPLSTLGGSAENVSYTNADFPTYTNVDLALDAIFAKLYYVEPQISSFTSTPSTLQYENGAVITGGVVFNWTHNKDMTSQTLTDCTLADETVRTATYANDISANKTFTLTCGDGEKTATKSISFQFMNKVYWGVSADQDNYTDAWILGLSGNKLATNAKGSYDFTAGTGQYCYWAIPTGMSISVKVNGFDTDLDTVVASRSFTNASGYTTTYKIVRLHQPSLGTLTAVVS